MMGPGHLEFLGRALGGAEEEMKAQVRLLGDQARGLRRRWWLFDKASLVMLIGGLALSLAEIPNAWQLTAVGAFFWVLVEVTKLRYEQVYGQIQREGRLAGEVEQLSAIEGLGECVTCSTPNRYCVRCGTALSFPAVLERPEFLDDIVLKRLQELVR